MAIDEPNQQKLLDVEFIQERLKEGYTYTNEAKDRDLILVIGNTGVGKSTTCNYLLGHKLKEGKFKGRPVIETVDETNIKIGHEVKSETLYAKSILIDHVPSENGSMHQSAGNLCLLDCPGFFDNRTVEEKVIESISIELSIRNGRQIKGIMILISLHALQETRVGELRELVKTLISLFKEPVEMVNYSLFVITKKSRYMPDAEAREITIGALGSLKDYCKEQATRYYANPNLNSTEKLSYIDYDRIATYFSAVLERHKNIIFINPLDNGESRTIIFNQINGIKPRRGLLKGGLALAKKTIGIKTDEPVRPITIDDFNFSEYDEHRILFNKALYHLADDGHKLMDKIRQEVENIGKFISDIYDAKNRLVKLDEEQLAIEDDLKKTQGGKIQGPKSYSGSIKSWKNVILQNQEWIESKENKANEISQNIWKLDKDLKSIDHDTPLKFIEKSVYRMISWWGLFGWEEMVFSADTGDTAIPIIDVQWSMKNGKWVKETDERSSGIYKITYQSQHRARPAEASVKTFIKTKDEVGNRITIKRINENLSQLVKDQKRLESEIKLLNSSNQILKLNIEEVETNAQGYENTLKRELKKCKDDIEHYNSEKVQKKEAVNHAKASGLENLRSFYLDQNKYAILVNINSLLKFPSMLIRRFTSEYNLFLNDVDTYQSCFDEEGTFSMNLPAEEERVFGLKDPITGSEIKDLVITLAGTPFDEHSLLNQFDTSNADGPPPIIFEHPDGTVEKIKYLVGWNKISRQQSQAYYSPTTPVQNFTCSKSEINQMTLEQLKEKEERVLEDIQSLREKLEAKEILLEKIHRQKEKLGSDARMNEMFSEQNDISP